MFFFCLLLQPSSTVKAGSFVWVKDPEEAWLDGEVIEVNGDDIKVQCTSGKTVCNVDNTFDYMMREELVSHTCVGFFFQVVVKVSDTHPKDLEVPPSGVTDMTTLAYLHEPGVLQNFKLRYHIDEIYVSFLFGLLFLFFFLLNLFKTFCFSLLDLYRRYLDCCEPF